MSTRRSVRYIERSVDEYSVGALVEELRMEARCAWRVMHEFRRKAANEMDQEQRHSFVLSAFHFQRQLISCLQVLNAGLGRVGSYDGAYTRRVHREVEEFKANIGVVA